MDDVVEIFVLLLTSFFRCSLFVVRTSARIKIAHFFSAPGLCSLFARAKMLYRRLVDDVVEIFVFLHTSYFSYDRSSFSYV